MEIRNERKGASPAMGNKLYPAVLSLLSCLLLTCCSAPNDNAPAENRVHPPVWTNPKLKGDIQYHGTYANIKGADSCRKCHGGSLQGNGSIRGCTNACHFGIGGETTPPGSSWPHAESPHSGAGLIPEADICNQCHNILRQYGLAPETCHDCHGQGINHPLGQEWLDVNSIAFHGRSNLECSDCHNPDRYCNQCHFGSTGSFSPLASGWTHANDVGHLEFTDQMTVCNKCHDLERSFGNPPAACHDCHPITADHPLGRPWLDPMISGFHGQSDLDCGYCHYLGTYCIQCHFGATGSRVPAGSNWAHGENDGHKDFEAFQNICTTCHNLNRSWGNPPASCHDCHPTVNHPLGQPWLDKNSSEFHGRNDLDCVECHNLKTDCGECHFGATGSRAPAGSNWTHGRNDRHESFEAYQSVCNRCHNLNRSYGNAPRSCHDCHGEGGDDDDD